MSVNGIRATDYLVVYGMRGMGESVAEKNFADEISKATAKIEMEELHSGTTIKYLGKERSEKEQLHYLKDDVDKTSELEHKFCSLCGSMIKSDGSCSLCGVPIFISGNGQSHNQNVSQVAGSHLTFKNQNV